MGNEVKVIEKTSTLLKKLFEKDRETTNRIRKLHLEMRSIINDYLSCGEITLFYRDELYFEARGHFYSESFTIHSVKITASPWHNNCFDKDVYCESILCIVFEIKCDREQQEWRCPLSSFKMYTEEWESRIYGFVSRGATGVSSNSQRHFVWGDEFWINDHSDFVELEEIIYQGFTKSGIYFEEKKK
jgi:hypothetical protein